MAKGLAAQAAVDAAIETATAEAVCPGCGEPVSVPKRGARPRGCAACGRPLTGRQRGACSARCRARLSRQRRAAAETLRRAREGPWRFRVQPAGRRFGWRGVVYASDRRTGVLEVHDPAFAMALRRLATRDLVEEIVPAGDP